MPRKTKKTIKGSQQWNVQQEEFESAAYPGRIKAQRARNRAVLSPVETVGKAPIARKQRAQAQASEKALSRVEGRMSARTGTPKGKPMGRLEAMGHLLKDAVHIGKQAKKRVGEFQQLAKPKHYGR